MVETLIVKYNCEDFGEPVLTVGRINPETEQVRLVANYTGEMAVDIFNILTHNDEEDGEKSDD